jgi:hypothetical protein
VFKAMMTGMNNKLFYFLSVLVSWFQRVKHKIGAKTM